MRRATKGKNLLCTPSMHTIPGSQCQDFMPLLTRRKRSYSEGCRACTEVSRLECPGSSRCRRCGSVTSSHQRMVPPVAPPPMPPEPAALDEPLEPDEPAVPDDLAPEPNARLWPLSIPVLPWPAPVAPELDVPDAPDRRLLSSVAPGVPVALCCRLTEGVLSSRLVPLGPRLLVDALLS